MGGAVTALHLLQGLFRGPGQQASILAFWQKAPYVDYVSLDRAPAGGVKGKQTIVFAVWSGRVGGMRQAARLKLTATFRASDARAEVRTDMSEWEVGGHRGAELPP